MKSKESFLLYIFITLFLGLSIQQFLHLTIEGKVLSLYLTTLHCRFYY